MNLVIVEKDKIEGYTAAWVAKRSLKQECELVFFGQGDKLPETGKKDVLIFGISFSRGVVERLAKKAAADHCEFKIFDNDFRAKQELAGIKEVKINLKQTPARMAWEFLRANFRVKIGLEGKKQEFHFLSAPWIVDYTEDNRIWKWPALNIHFIKLAIDNCYKQELESWDELASRDLDVLIEQGKDFLKKQQQEREEDNGRQEEQGDGSKQVRGQTSRKSESKK